MEDDQSYQASTAYVITYSQANFKKHSTREKLENVVKDGFSHVETFNCVLQCACSKEKHSNGRIHYHFALK